MCLQQHYALKTFTDVDIVSSAGKAALARAEAHAEDFEGVWKQVNKFSLYDPLTLLAATPRAGELVFRGDVPAGVNGNVQVVGKNSIKDSSLMKDLLAGLVIESLNPPVPPKSHSGRSVLFHFDSAPGLVRRAG